MPALRALLHRVAGLFGRQRHDSEFTAELEANLQLHIEENVRRGMSAEEARRDALVKFGSFEAAREAQREQRGLPFLDALVQDLRFALRMVRKNPGFTAVAVLTLALGIGANTAVFSIVYGVLLKPLPFPDSDRLVMISLRGRGVDRAPMGSADFLALEERQHVFTQVAAYAPSTLGFALTGFGVPQMIPGMAVTPAFFSVLEVPPALGRGPRPEEGKPGGELAVVVSDHFWRQFLGADPTAIGRKITLDERSYSVVGVMPPGFRYGQPGDVWPALQLQPSTERPPYWLIPIGRLKPGVSLSQASGDASRIAAEVQRRFPLSDDTSAIVEPMREMWVGEERPALLILLGAVGFVLLIAVVNVASLQLSRAAARGREMAVRSALGAGRRRLVRQLLTESLLLAAAGGLLGVAAAYLCVRALALLSPSTLPRMDEVDVSLPVLAFTAGIAVVSGVLFGLAPAFQFASPAIGDSLKQGTRASSGRESHRTHNVLVAAEFTLALVVLAGAGLLIRTLAKMEAVSPGFNPDRIVSALVALPDARYSKAAEVTSYFDRLLDRIHTSPGVESSAIAISLPPNLLALTNPFHIEGRAETPGQPAPAVPEIPISDGYFRTLGVPLLRGREFSFADRAPGTHILIINENMARRYFPGEDAVGKRVQTGEYNPKADFYTIVGVVGNVKYEGLAAQDEPAMYVPFTDSGWCPWFVQSMYVVVRGGTTSAASEALPSSVSSIDRQLPLIRVRAMDELLYDSVADSRFRAGLFASFAGLALVLAATGIYGVVAYSVSQRTQEIAVRMALGAPRGSVFGLVLGLALRLAGAGVGVGVVAALALARLMRSLLFGVSPADPVAFMAAAVLLALVAATAGYVPARRAMNIHPTAALRGE